MKPDGILFCPVNLVKIFCVNCAVNTEQPVAYRHKTIWELVNRGSWPRQLCETKNKWHHQNPLLTQGGFPFIYLEFILGFCWCKKHKVNNIKCKQWKLQMCPKWWRILYIIQYYLLAPPESPIPGAALAHGISSSCHCQECHLELQAASPFHVRTMQEMWLMWASMGNKGIWPLWQLLTPVWSFLCSGITVLVSRFQPSSSLAN